MVWYHEGVTVGDAFFVVVTQAAEELELPVSEAELRATVDTEAVDAAIAAPYTRIDGQLLYPDPVEQAAIFIARIVQLGRMPCRAERLAALLFAELVLSEAKLELQASIPELDAVLDAIAAGRLADDVLIRWLNRHVRRVTPL